MAERSATANLTGIFGQSIQADQTIVNTYQEAVRNGVTQGWSDDIAMNNTIRTSASIDSLIGAEIREIWQETKNRNIVFYAVAVMDKAKTAQIYRDMLNANQNLINNLVNMNQNEKNSFEGYSRYQFAAVIADITITYANVLSVIDTPVTGLKRGNDYRLEAQNIVKAIPIGISVKNDKSARIQGAFAKAISELGFRSGGTNSRYVLNVNVVLSASEHPTNASKFVRMELEANLTDTISKDVLLPFNFSNREGHNTASEAENRCFLAAERKIKEEYKDLLFNYFSQLTPKK